MQEDWYKHICEIGTGLCAAAFYWFITDGPKVVPTEVANAGRDAITDHIVAEYKAHKGEKI